MTFVAISSMASRTICYQVGTLASTHISKHHPMTDVTPDRDGNHSGRYASIETGVDSVLIYDLDDPNAWLKSDCLASVRE